MLRLLLFIALLFTAVVARAQSYDEVDQINRIALSIMRDNPDSSQVLLEASINFSKEIDYSYGLATAYHLQARKKMLEHEDIEALKAFSKAYHHYLKTDSITGDNQAIICRNMASIYTRNYQFDQAIIFYDSALSLISSYIDEYPKRAVKTNRQKSLYDIIYYKGLAQKRAGQLEKANKTFRELWNSNGKRIQTKSVPRVLNQLGFVNTDLGNYKEARYFLNQILELDGVSKEYQARALHNIGHSYLNEGDHLTARDYFEKAIVKKRALGFTESNVKSLFITYLDLGETLYHLENYKDAVAAWELALSLNYEISADPKLFLIHNWLQQAYMLFDIDKANSHGVLYRDYNKSFNEKSSLIAQQIEADVFMLELQGDELEANYVVRVKREERKLLIQAVLGTGIIIIILLSIWHIWRKRKHQLFQKQMQALATKKPQ